MQARLPSCLPRECQGCRLHHNSADWHYQADSCFFSYSLLPYNNRVSIEYRLASSKHQQCWMQTPTQSFPSTPPCPSPPYEGSLPAMQSDLHLSSASFIVLLWSTEPFVIQEEGEEEGASEREGEGEEWEREGEGEERF